NLVLAGTRCVGKPGGAHDDPVQVALPDELFLAYMIHKHCSYFGKEWGDERDNPGNLSPFSIERGHREGGLADEAAHALFLHSRDDIFCSHRANGNGDAWFHAEYAEYHVLAGDGRFDRLRIEDVALNHGEIGMLDRKSLRVAVKTGNSISLLKSLLD